MSSTSETRGQAALWHLATIGIILLVGAIFLVLAWRAAASARVAFEQQRASEMMSESRALCEKWGLAAGTARFSECLADIQTVRDRQVERIREDDEPL
ncbi:MAG TPA: hypothetical protein VHQ92_04400 [Pseudolabrys sp.]|jgi:hypothetical protein|nr:hypothetical protein [Pseudolabrys sp.]